MGTGKASPQAIRKWKISKSFSFSDPLDVNIFRLDPKVEEIVRIDLQIIVVK
jgi:hypothetical protein